MTTRRDFLKSSGMLVVGFSAMSIAPASAFDEAMVQATGQGPGPYPDPDFRQLDSWIVIRENNTATFYVGKTDLGQGTGTAFRQIMSDELDIAYDKTSCVMGSTDVTVDQGGSGGSDALQTDGWPMRRVAAEARRVLLEMASSRLGVPVAALVVNEGVVSVSSDPSKRVTYGELIGGKKFNVTLTGKNTDTTTGTAKVKTIQELEIIGKSPQRYDIPPKVDGSLEWAVDAKVPGMVHARNVRPPVAGATLISVDEASVKSIPGFIKSCEQGKLRGRRVRARGAGGPRGATAQGQLAEADRCAIPDLRRSFQVHQEHDAIHQRCAQRHRHSRRGVCGRREGG